MEINKMDFLFKSDVLGIKESEWFSPNTYNKNFKPVPNCAGVYMIVSLNDGKYNVLYVGSSKNLQNRYRSHEVYRFLSITYRYVKFYFIEDEDYLQNEIKLIKEIKPPYNKQFNTREYATS